MRTNTLLQFSLSALFLMLFSALTPALAVQVEELFTVQMPVESREREQRMEAIKEGMGQVLVRITGDGSIIQNAEVEGLVRGAAQYVQRFRYLPAKEGDGFELIIDFDESRLSKDLGNRGLPVWGRERPAVLSWIAVSQGSNRFMISSKGKRAEREVLNEAAKARGVPLIFPLLDVEDNNKVRSGDIFGGFYDTVDEASQRYSADAVLIGRVQRQQGQWLGRWRLREGDQSVVYESEGSSLDEALTKGVFGLASYLASWHVTQGFTDQANTVEVYVDQVSSLAEYFKVRDYLKSFDAVLDVMPRRIRLAQAQLDVQMRGSARDLERLIMLGDVLKPKEPEYTDDSPVSTSGLYYRLIR